MKKIRSGAGRKGIGITVFLMLLALITIFPFYLMISMGTHSTAEIFRGDVLLPGSSLLKNLAAVKNSSFALFYWNSIVSSVAATAVGTLTSAMAGYALSKYQFRLRGSLISYMMALMMIPSQISLIAYVIEMRNMNMLNTLWPVMIPFMFSAFGVYWMKQSFDSSLPDEVLESARIDGASEFRIFFEIALPFSRASLITIALLLFLWSWNNYILPLITINDMKKYTVPLGIAMLNGMYRTDYGAKILALALGTIPLVILFIFGSKYFIRGLTGGAVKG